MLTSKKDKMTSNLMALTIEQISRDREQLELLAGMLDCEPSEVAAHVAELLDWRDMVMRGPQSKDK